MSTYIFILGKDPELSMAELASRYPSSTSTLKSMEFSMMALDQPFDQKEFNRLGGQIKAGEVFDKSARKDLISKITDHLSRDHHSGKLNYGISVYGWSEKNLRSLLLDLKKEFKKRGVSSRFANQRFLNISAAQHKGLSGGKEILVCKDGSDFYLAEVIAVQDIDAYSKRDYKKPFRDMKVGMLPPKLAQIMINLTKSDGIIWDPFCGGGVLIMEGLLMEHPMLGSDINAKTLEGAKKNVSWLKKEFGSKAEADLFVHNATKPLPDKKFDAVACEGYLGPPQSRLKSKREFVGIVDELSVLYRSFFASLKSGSFDGPVVIGLPFYKTREGDLSLDEVIRGIEKMGFEKDLSLKYARKDQLVGRAIYRFRQA
jgi:tRNA G10  N-methylase Trm11